MTATISGLTLHDHWLRMMERLRSPDECPRTFQRLISCYELPTRVYHGTGHLADVLEAAELLADELDAADESRGAIALAAFYHDVICIPGKTDNEVRSVEVMIEDLASVRMHPLAVSAATLGIFGTIPGHVPKGRMSKILSDADLLVLATSPEAYDRYAKAVREEYRRYFTVEQYETGRAEVLRHLINIELFHYAAGEEQAKANMRRELKGLQQ